MKTKEFKKHQADILNQIGDLVHPGNPEGIKWPEQLEELTEAIFMELYGFTGSKMLSKALKKAKKAFSDPETELLFDKAHGIF